MNGISRRANASNVPAAAWFALMAVVATLIGLGLGRQATASYVYLAFAGCLGLAAAVLILWKAELGVPAMLFAASFDVGGRVISQPVSLTLYQIALLLTLVSWGVRLLGGDRAVRPRFTLIDAGLALLLFAALWSFPNSLDKSDTMTAAIRLVFIYLFYVASATLMRRQWVLDAALAAVVVSGCLHGAIALAQTRISGFSLGNTSVTLGGPNSPIRGSSFFDDPNYLAAFLSAAILIALLRAVHANGARPVLLWLAAAGVCGLGLYATYSRTGIVGVAVGLPIIWLTAPAGRKKWIFIAGAFGLMAVFAVSSDVIISRLANSGSPDADTSIATRYYMLESTIAIIRDYWAMGTGLGAFDVAYPAYRLAGSSYSVIRPHQLILALWAEMGVAGLLAETFITFATVRLTWITWADELSFGQKVGIVLVLSLAVQSLFQYFLYFEYVWFSLAVLAAASVVKVARPSEVSHA